MSRPRAAPGRLGQLRRKATTSLLLRGLAWSLLGIPLPHLLQVTLTEIGSVTAGLALFLTGLVLSAQTIEFSGNAYVLTLPTIVIRPLIAVFPRL